MSTGAQRKHPDNLIGRDAVGGGFIYRERLEVESTGEFIKTREYPSSSKCPNQIPPEVNEPPHQTQPSSTATTEPAPASDTNVSLSQEPPSISVSDQNGETTPIQQQRLQQPPKQTSFVAVLQPIIDRLTKVEKLTKNLALATTKVDSTQRQLYDALKQGLAKRRHFASEVDKRLLQFESDLLNQSTEFNTLVDNSVSLSKKKANEVLQNCHILVDDLTEQFKNLSDDFTNNLDESRSVIKQHKSDTNKSLKKLERKFDEDLDEFSNRLSVLEKQTRTSSGSSSMDTKQLFALYNSVNAQRAAVLSLQLQNKSEQEQIMFKLNALDSLVKQSQYRQTFDSMVSRANPVSDKYLLIVFLLIVGLLWTFFHIISPALAGPPK